MAYENKIRLLEVLADGEFHSGETLGDRIGVSRAAVWKILQSFADWGVYVERVRGKGYRIAGGVDLLDAEVIGWHCASNLNALLDSFEMFYSINSTNTYILDIVRENPTLKSKRACLAEMQTAGRGRRGRQWQSPFARNIYLSLSWPFEGGAAAMQGLSLAVGVVVVRALENLGCENLALKWPNDILYGGSKLGGILVEIAGDASGLCHAVIGLGLNVRMSQDSVSVIDQAWIDLAAILDPLPSRNVIVAEIMRQLIAGLEEFSLDGFTPFQSFWQSRNAHLNQPVDLSSTSDTVFGVMRGVDASGAVLLEVDGEIKSFVGGELSLRSAI